MFSTITPVVKNIIFICVGVFILDKLFANYQVTERLALWKVGTDYFKPYQLFTYMFAHGSLGHLFFNMLSLTFMASMLEMLWGFKRFLTFYLAAGIGAGVIYMALEAFLNPHALGSMVGASGAIYGILVAFGMLFPDREISLMLPPIQVKAKYLVFVLGFFNYIMDDSGQVAHMAHLGGAIIGFFLVKFGRF
jgi:membrane associated rhomboid family serine protease